jgi:CBS domain-containing protein
MLIRDAMTREVHFADPRQNLEDVARQMITEDIGFMPVIENGRLVGVVTDRDMAVRGFTDNMSGANLVRDVMSIDAVHCLEDDDVGTAINTMADLKIRRLPVLDRDEHLVGVIALADLISSEPGAVAALKTIMTPGPPNSQIADLDPVGTAGHRF